MAAKSKRRQDNSKITNQAGGSIVGGSVSVTGGSRFVGRDDNSRIESEKNIRAAFEQFHKMIDEDTKLSEKDKNDTKALVNNVQTELTKKEGPNESFVTLLFKDIQKMAPDIIQVIASTLLNPSVGLSLVAKKIVDRAAKEASSQAQG